MRVNKQGSGNVPTEDEYSIFKLHDSDTYKYLVNLNINDCVEEFEVDTGAAVTCVGESTYKKLEVPGQILQDTCISLRDYNKNPLSIAGVVEVQVQYENQYKILPLVVVKSVDVHSLSENYANAKEILEKYDTVFDSNLGCLKDFEVSLKIKKKDVLYLCIKQLELYLTMYEIWLRKNYLGLNL